MFCSYRPQGQSLSPGRVLFLVLVVPQHPVYQVLQAARRIQRADDGGPHIPELNVEDGVDIGVLQAPEQHQQRVPRRLGGADGAGGGQRY